MGPARRKDRDAVSLVRYDAACRALAAARSTDEVKKIRDLATAMKTYAKQAKNKQLEIDAAEIRIRAERRVGELIEAQRQSVGLGKAGRPPKEIGFDSNPISKPATLAEIGIDKNLADRARKLAALPDKHFEQQVTDWRHRSAQTAERVSATLLHARKPSNGNVHFSSESPEHYTPEEFLQSVYQVFQGIPDLDPCSNRGRPNVTAHQHYTAKEDGLKQPWQGRVFLNPPYGRELPKWITKLRQEWNTRRVREVIALLPARTDPEWFEELTADADDLVICFLRRRLTFVGNTESAPFPSMAVYLGPHHDVFARTFLDLGSLWQRPGTPLEWFIDHS